MGLRLSKKVLILFAATAIAVVSGCAGGEDGEVEAKLTCGGLSDLAATAMADITGESRFPASSQADAKVFSENFSGDVVNGGKDPHVFCEVFNSRGDDFPNPKIKFTLSSKADIPPPVEEGLVGESNFPVALRSVSNSRGADIYFECRAPWMKNKDTSTVIRAELDYEKTSRAGLGTLKKNMDLLQHVTHGVAEELECENHGGIQKRNKPW
ncbi:hypothetical protein [Streptomyces sp. CNQ085]|uniref:hypothetical protein n=1 Tax=Streptomyces sp. CNQ085 TaxID=2886944 RepID=UPI001F514C89|nr:hypothetical protein [Streptomyces sp. CNQ085]MCI0385898.1 hypothetical protein [Streptomyces sp. CNQ085]